MEVETVDTLKAGPAILAYERFDFGIAAWLIGLGIEKVERAITAANEALSFVIILVMESGMRSQV